MGVVLYSFYMMGELVFLGFLIFEGIGQGCIIVNFEGFKFDYLFQIFDEEVLLIVFDLLENEGFCFGGFFGVNIVGVKCLVKEMGLGYIIVMILCDYGMCYQFKFFNLEFLCEKGLLILFWLIDVLSSIFGVFEDV